MVPSQKIVLFFYVSQFCGVQVSVGCSKDYVDFLSVCCHVSLFISDCVSLDVFSHLLLVCIGVCLFCFIFSNNLLFLSLVHCIFCLSLIYLSTQFDYFMFSTPFGHVCFFFFVLEHSYVLLSH